MDLHEHLAQRVAAIVPEGARVCVGLSGGLDSVVLADLLATLHASRAFTLSALHVHHGLSPNADAWAQFCRRFCDERGIALSIERVRVDRGSPAGLEGAAREARYAVYASRPEEFVALAHHLDDQAETALLQLLRGTGLRGVAAMPEVRPLPGSAVRLFRPLLPYPRSALAAHARARGLAWMEDESNAAVGHDRNFLRHEVGPRLDARFPGWRSALARFSRRAAAAERLLGELARIDGLPERAGEALGIPEALSPERRANLLRGYLALHEVPMPSEATLSEMASQLFGARGDARIRIEHAGLTLVRHRGAVSLQRLGPAPGAWHVPWNGEPLVDLGEGRGSVRWIASTGKGIDVARAREPGWHFGPRAGGERLKIDPRRPTRTLKNLLQESRLPTWERERLPLLFHGERLVWVPEVGVAADYACPSEAPGVEPAWIRPR